MSENGALSARQTAAIVALGERGTVRAAAAVVGVNERTLYRWLTDPVFIAELRRQRAGIVDSGYGLLVAGVVGAVATLRTIMADGNVPPAVRLRAAESILTHVFRIGEMHDFEVRLAALENRPHETR